MRVRQCARCGSRPRWNDTFLCEQCSHDPQQKEVNEALSRTSDFGSRPNSARDYLVKTFHWAGWR